LKESGKNYKRIVIKIGSSLFFGQEGLSEHPMAGIAEQVSGLIREGRRVVIVSSGAIAWGMHALSMKARPRELSALQAAAAVGQHLLMGQYQKYFEKKALHCAQILLTWDDFGDRKRCLNARNTIASVLALGCIPVVNENDTISTDEIRFGDNDQLSALVASNLVSADLLIILSDVDGLLDKDKKVVRVVPEIDHEVKMLACPTDKCTSVGGMITKIEAAKIAVDSGFPCVIANGRTKGVITSLVRDPDAYGTLFKPKAGLTERERWMAFGTKTKGRIVVDDGARQALINRKSLLAVGIVAVEGHFEAGDIVSIRLGRGIEIARGKAGISSRQLDKIKGAHFDKEVIHRDNIVIL